MAALVSSGGYEEKVKEGLGGLLTNKDNLERVTIVARQGFAVLRALPLMEVRGHDGGGETDEGVASGRARRRGR
jgi:hypothetical protein